MMQFTLKKSGDTLFFSVCVVFRRGISGALKCKETRH
uniref:Uncharacterized protein n=1 Tax=Anguilla anguilla TaxID=7936 RepID=A0A0E9UAS3_ANGAN